LRGAPFELQALEGRREQASARPNPELELELENFAGSGDMSGTDALESTLALSQLIELGGRRDARIALATSEYDLLRAEQDVHRLDLQAEVARRFLDVVADQERLALARRTAQLATEVHAGVQRRVDAARSPIAEASRADIARIRAELDVSDTERQLESSRYSLAASWGAARADFSVARADLQQFPDVGTFDALASQLEENPDQLRYLSEQRMREAELRLAQATKTPGFTVGAGVRRFEETGDNAFVLSFSIPLAIANRNAGAIAESQARIAALPYARDAALLENVRAFATDLGAGQLWLEKLILDTKPQASHAASLAEDGALGELLGYLRQLRSEDAALVQLANEELYELRAKLPADLREGIDGLKLDDPQLLRDELDAVEQLLLVRLFGMESSA